MSSQEGLIAYVLFLCLSCLGPDIVNTELALSFSGNHLLVSLKYACAEGVCACVIHLRQCRSIRRLRVLHNDCALVGFGELGIKSAQTYCLLASTSRPSYEELHGELWRARNEERCVYHAYCACFGTKSSTIRTEFAQDCEWSRVVEPLQCAAREVEPVARAMSPGPGKLATSLIRVPDKYIDIIKVAAVSL